MNLEDHGFSLEEQIESQLKIFTEQAGTLRRQLIKQGWSRNGAEQLTKEFFITSMTNANNESLIQGMFKRQ